MSAPRWQERCTSCVFLGDFGEHDLYVCFKPTTVIARFGPEGDYLSGFAFSVGPHAIPALREARERAERRGLLPTPEKEGAA